MGDAFVAINTGLLFRDAHFVHFLRICALCGKIHRVHAVTATAGRRITRLELCPDGLRHLQTVFFKFFRGIDFFGYELMINIF